MQLRRLIPALALTAALFGAGCEKCFHRPACPGQPAPTCGCPGAPPPIVTAPPPGSAPPTAPFGQ